MNMYKTTRTLLTLVAVTLLAMAATGCSGKMRMARHQRLADKYYAAGNLQKAEVEYLISLQWDAANAHNISRLADIYYQQGRFRRAYSYALKASELSDAVDLHVKLGTIYLMAHKTKEAREQAELALKQSPTNADAPTILVESVSSRPELDQAQKRLQELSKQIGDTAPLEVAFALANYGAGDVKAATASVQKALSIDPTNSAAYYTLGNLNLAEHKMEEADAAFKKAAELAPLRSPRRLSYANFKIQTGDLAEGKRILAEIVDKVPDYLPATLRQAEIALAEKRYSDCELLLNQALARDVDNYEALLLRSRLYLVQGKNDKAVAELERMSAIYEHSGDVLYYLALAHVAANDTTKATADLNKALFLQPKNPEATVLLAQLNIQKGDTASAITSLNELIRQKPGIAEAYMLLANAYVLQRNLDQALATYTQMSQYFPKSPQVPIMAGMILAQQKRTADARKAFEKALELSPHSSVAHEQLVDLDLAAHNYDAALARVNKELEAEPKPGPGPQLLLAKIHVTRANDLTEVAKKTNPAVHKIGDVAAAQDDIKQAETALLKAIQLDPSLTTSYLLLAKLYVSAGREHEALDRLNGLLSKTNNLAAYMQLGAIQESLTNYPAARDAYEKALAINPDFGPVINNLSYLYSERLGNLDKGYELAEKARQLAPRDPFTADTLGWVLYRRGEYQRALGLLLESASKMPGQPEIQLHLGLVQYMLGDESGARSALEQATNSTEEFSSKEEAGRHLAILAIDPKTADAKVRADLEKKLQDDPSDPVAANRLAAIYEREGSLDKAAKTYEQTLKVNPQNAMLMARLARIYLALKNSDRALDLAKQAHKLVPDDAAISCLLGRLVFQTGDYNWAASLLQEASPKLSNQPEVKYDLAWSYYSIGRVGDAESTVKAAAPALTNSPRQADANQFLAMLAAAKSPTPAAATQAGQILGTNGDYVPALMVAGAQAEKQGKQDDARGFYEKALAKYPAFLPAARNLSILYAQRPGDEQKAYDLGMKARPAYPGDAQLARALGIVSYRRGDYSGASQLLQEGSQGSSNKDGELLYYLGKAHYQLKQKSQSKTELQAALSLNLEAKLADDARKTLAELK